MRKLTAKSSLDTLRRQAKRWLGEIRAGDADAHARFVRMHSRPPSGAGLRDVQHALAREHGFSSWNDLKIALADLTADARSLDQQLDTATPCSKRRRMLASTWSRCCSISACLPLSYVLAITLNWQHSGVFWGVFVSETSVGLFTLWLFSRGSGRRKQV